MSDHSEPADAGNASTEAGNASTGAGDAPLVAIVGRPNVGKSTLFNRLVGARQAIVEDHPGVTRDRLYGVAEWTGRQFLVVDTGGIDPSLETGLPAHIQAQVEVAIEEADLILLVVDAIEGLSAVDLDIAERLRRAGKPVIVVANKADSDARQQAAAAAWELGLGPVFAVSAAHGRGAAELCDELAERVGVSEVADPVPPGTRLAFIGRPNAGKSTLVNTLLGSPRVIVDDVPGTTRDAVYLPFRYRDHDLVLIDTAGLRRRKQIARAQEKLAAIKSIRAMERTEVVVLVIDATEGVTDQDQRIARMAFTRGKGVVVLMHKWDLVAGDAKRAQEVREQADEALAFLERPFVIRTSVVGEGRDVGQGRGRGMTEVLDACLRTARALSRRIPTAELNDELIRAVADHSPPAHGGRLVRLYFATQADRTPPFLVISANRSRCLDPAYERYLVRRFRKRWELRGVPVRMVVRGKDREGEGES
jgi:GTP-binding protein